MNLRNDYPLFNHWFKTLMWFMDRTESMPKHVRFTLSQRIIQHSLDIMEGILEAIYTKERVPILQKLNQKLEILRVLIRICYERKYLSINQYRYAASQLERTGQMIGGWLRSLE